MAQINEAESLQGEIENHLHFNKCFSTNAKNEFYSKRDELNKARTIFNDLKNNEIDIIKVNLDKKKSEVELNNLRNINKNELENLKEKLKVMEEINIKTNENELNGLKDEYSNFQLKKKYDLEQLDIEISNLNKQIIAIRENLNQKLDLQTKEELLKMTNEFEIKLLQHTNQKKLEKQEKEKEFEVRKKKFEADKAIEFIELKRKADLVQRIIAMFKNISLI